MSPQILDCCGQLCPVPILMTEEAIADIRKGETLEVVFTDPGAEPDLKLWCKVNGHEFVLVKRERPKIYATIRK